jgi:hypothetical protein
MSKADVIELIGGTIGLTVTVMWCVYIGVWTIRLMGGV